MIKKDKQEIIDLLLEKFDCHRKFETDDFYYWINEYYKYNREEMSRWEFQAVKDYAVKHGTLPFIKIEDKIHNIRDEKEAEKKENKGFRLAKDVNLYNKNTNTGTYCRQKLIRYSKKYHNLEVYEYDVEVRSPASKPTDRVLVLSKKTKVLSINDKNYVLIGGNRWLSLKNWTGFARRYGHYVSENTVKKLMSLMLGNVEWLDSIGEIEPMNISNPSARKANSLNEAVELECGAKPAKIIRRALSNDINEIISLYRLIDPNQIHNLTNFIKRNHAKLDKLINSASYNYSKSQSLLYFYYLSKDSRLMNNSHIAKDYIRMSEQEGLKINLNISSARTIKDRHDEISRAIVERSRDKSKLRVAKAYPRIKEAPGMEIELIRSAERLNLESTILHHCVHSYKRSVNNGSCAIYSLLFDEERYTLEVRAKKIEQPESDGEEPVEHKYEYTAAQLRGKYNCNPPLEMEQYFRDFCNEHNFKFIEGRIVFVDKNPEKKKTAATEKKKPEIKQVGEEILSVLLSKTITTDRELPF
jgi:hypothetical protein